MEKRIVVLGAAKLVNGQWQEVANFKKMGKFYAAAQLQERMVEPTEESIFEKRVESTSNVFKETTNDPDLAEVFLEEATEVLSNLTIELDFR